MKDDSLADAYLLQQRGTTSHQCVTLYGTSYKRRVVWFYEQGLTKDAERRPLLVDINDDNHYIEIVETAHSISYRAFYRYGAGGHEPLPLYHLNADSVTTLANDEWEGGEFTDTMEINVVVINGTLFVIGGGGSEPKK